MTVGTHHREDTSLSPVPAIGNKAQDKSKPRNLILRLQGLPDLTYVKTTLFLPLRLGIAKASLALCSACRQLKNYYLCKRMLLNKVNKVHFLLKFDIFVCMTVS